MIYFVTAREIGRVKIGFSDNPDLRFIRMQNDSPVELTAERLMAGGRETEAVLHHLFAAERIRGKWFELTARIDEFMAGLPIPTETRRAAAKSVNDGSVAALINERGGIRSVARKLGHLNPSTVQGWVKRNRIPESSRDRVLALPIEKGAVKAATSEAEVSR